MPHRPLHVRLGWTLRDYAKRVWDNSGEDNIFFLAGGITFNALLAAVPFVLLVAGGLAYVLGDSQDKAIATISDILARFLPANEALQQKALDNIKGIIKQRGTITLYSAIAFVWFSTRLFGTLRSVLGEVFDIEQGRSIIAGKIFDIQITVVSTLLVLAYTVLSTYLALATTRGARLLVAAGLRSDVMGWVEYSSGRLLAFAFIFLTFFFLYKVLPNRRIRAPTALLAAGFTSTLLEIAKTLFGAYITSSNPGSLYTTTLASIVIVVLWSYYAALCFIVGGEIAQVYELRRVRRLQRETFES